MPGFAPLAIAPIGESDFTPASVIPYEEHLLPPNALPFEKALSATLQRVLNVPIPVRDVWSAERCPAPLLPWMAWGFSVDVWDEAWPEQKKRAIIAQSFELHRRKGTLDGIARHLSFAGAPLRAAIVPPDKFFLAHAFTDEQRAAWLARFAQIRIFRFRNRGVQTYGAFTSRGAYKLHKSFLGDQSGNPTFFPYTTDAPDRWGRRAFLWDKGSHPLATGLETPMRWIEREKVVQQEHVYDYERVLIPGKARSVFLGSTSARGNFGRKDGRWFPIKSRANTRIVTLSVQRDLDIHTEISLPKFAVRPSLEPITVFPEQIAERGTSKRGQQIFCSRKGRWLDPETKQRKIVKGFLKGYMPGTTSRFRLYDRIHLHDPLRLPDRRSRGTYLGHARLGMPAFTAKLSVEVRGNRPIWLCGPGRFIHGFLKSSTHKNLELAKQAVQRSKSARDKILLRTKLYRPVGSGDGLTSASGVTSSSLINIIDGTVITAPRRR
jgi:phage tail-like protein